MPTGMSFCGFFASCAAVETASKPMYAKNTTPAARTTPDHPKLPKPPVFGGTNGCQLAVFTYLSPKAITRSTIAIFTYTITLLKRADSLIPTTSSVVIAMMSADRRQVDDAARHSNERVRSFDGERRLHERFWQIDADTMEEGTEVPRPPDSNCRRAEEILEHEIPSNDPRDELAERRVAIGVRASGNWNHRRELRVAQTGEEAAGSGEDERVDDRGPGVQRGGRTGQHENTRADDRADSQQCQIARGEHALELVCAGLSRLVLKHRDTFSGEQTHANVSRQNRVGDRRERAPGV